MGRRAEIDNPPGTRRSRSCSSSSRVLRRMRPALVLAQGAMPVLRLGRRPPPHQCRGRGRRRRRGGAASRVRRAARRLPRRPRRPSPGDGTVRSGAGTRYPRRRRVRRGASVRCARREVRSEAVDHGLAVVPPSAVDALGAVVVGISSDDVHGRRHLERAPSVSRTRPAAHRVSRPDRTPDDERDDLRGVVGATDTHDLRSFHCHVRGDPELDLRRRRGVLLRRAREVRALIEQVDRWSLRRATLITAACQHHRRPPAGC